MAAAVWTVSLSEGCSSEDMATLAFPDVHSNWAVFRSQLEESIGQLATSSLASVELKSKANLSCGSLKKNGPHREGHCL